LTDRRRRLPAVFPPFAIALLLAVALLPALVAPVSAATGPADPPGLGTFLRALGQVESGGRYVARNHRTGAYGKYQILPSTWRAWSRHYLHVRDAYPTPHNQEVVARARVVDLYRSFSSWSAVAHWWLTGRAPTDPRSRTASAGRYVRHVMAVYARFTGSAGPGSGGATLVAGSASPARLVTHDDRSSLVTLTGHWRFASGSGYFHRTATSSRQAGSSAIFPFVGRSIELFGAIGPTRGRVLISVDGGAPATVDLHRASYRPNVRLFSHAWTQAGRHWITIEVVGTPGHPEVSFDSFVVGR
jgi:hypothetical protein